VQHPKLFTCAWGQAGLAVMKAQGEKHINVILPLLEEYLNQPAPPSEGACASVPQH